MYFGEKLIDGNTALQDRVQRHYGRVISAGDATTAGGESSAIASNNASSANASWQSALSDALARANPLAEMQAAIKAREAELAERERVLASREQALKARIPAFELPRFSR